LSACSCVPKRFGVGSGFIIDQNDSLSKQTDLVTYDAYNCPVYRGSDNAAIIPSEYVAAVVQVKARLDKKRLSEAFENIAAAKSIVKTAMPDGEATQTTLGCVFAFNSPLKMATIAYHYAEEVRSRGLGRHIDLILVLDRGIITLAWKPPGHEWGTALLLDSRGPEGAHIFAAASEMGEDSLDAFLRHLLLTLAKFRPVSAHPLFNWNPPLKGLVYRYVGSFTKETDPERRAAKIKEYTAEAKAYAAKAEEHFKSILGGTG
jgi:hypothetical protein